MNWTPEELNVGDVVWTGGTGSLKAAMEVVQ